MANTVSAKLCLQDECYCYCLSNAMHCMGQNIKSLAACVCVCVRARDLGGGNISKSVRDRGLVTMGHQ